MASRHRRHDSSDSDISIEEGQTRHRHRRYRSKSPIDRRGRDRVSDSSSSDDESVKVSPKKIEQIRSKPKSDDENREIRDLSKKTDRRRESSESDDDRSRKVDKNSRKSDEQRDMRGRRDVRDSSPRRNLNGDRRREVRGYSSVSGEERPKSNVDRREVVDDTRKNDRGREVKELSRRRHASDSEKELEKNSKEEVKSRSEEEERDLPRKADDDVKDLGRRNERRRHDSDSEKELAKEEGRDGRRSERRRHDSDSEKELEKIAKQKAKSPNEEEERDLRGGRDLSRRSERKRHDSDFDKDLAKNQNEDRKRDERGDRDFSRRDDKRRHHDRRKRESDEESSEEEEKLKGRKDRREGGRSRRRGSDEIDRDREKEKRVERRRDDRFDARRTRHRGGREEEVEIPDRHGKRERDGYERSDFKEKGATENDDGRKSQGNLEAGNAPTQGNNGVTLETSNFGKTGGVYIPPFKLAQMMRNVEDKSSKEYQRLTWDALRKSINGLVNKVNAANIKNIVTELFAENLIRGRGLFCRSCMKSQMASPGFTGVFAALVAVVNTKFPEVGELLLRRIVLQLQRSYKRNDKHQLLASVKFIAHLVNQQVAHEIVALELLTILLESPTDDSVEVAVGFVTECGSLLQDLSPQGLHGIFERFRGILHEGTIDKRVQFMIEGLFAIRKAKFQGHPAVLPELDLVDQEDQLTHEISLVEDNFDPEINLDIFKVDPDFLENEKKYDALMKNILGDESAKDEDEASSDEPSGDEEDEDSDEDDPDTMRIKDETETNLVNLRRTIYLTIMSSVDFEEAGHKLMKIKLEPGQEMELCTMLLECCSQERTYLRYYGLLGQRFCMINKIHQVNFETCFVQQYSLIHRLETNKLRNVAKFFAHLLGTDALPWHVLSYIRLTEEDTTSSSRIFIKILFQELSEHLGIRLLNERLTDPAMQDSFESIFPKDNPKNTRFSINFFTSIGLGGITENLREYLKNMPRLIMQQQIPAADSDASGSSSPSSSASHSSSESESEEDNHRRNRRRRR